MVERGVETILNSVPGMNGRATPVYRPTGLSVPCITYFRTGTERDYHARGESGKAKASITVRCHAATYDAAMELADKVRLKMAGYRGQNGDVFIQSCFLMDESDDQDDAQFAGNKPDVFRRILSFDISYVEQTQQHIAKG